MSVCWDCHWGWPKPVADIYDKALADLGGYESALEFGPGHIVWSEENFDFAERCLESFDADRDKWGWSDEYSESELAIVKRSLQELAALPLAVRCVEPEDYDGEHPELFPPPEGVEMVRWI